MAIVFGPKPKPAPIFDELMGFTFEGAGAFLEQSKLRDPPILTNMLTAMIAGLATGGLTTTILAKTMPQSMAGVNKDILVLDCLAYATTTLQQGLRSRHKKDRGQDGSEQAWLSSSSMAKTIKDHKLVKFAPEIGAYWLDRWNEFRKIEDPHERFGLLTYLVFTSRGHTTPMRRYPGSPPVLLDLGLGLETMQAELTCAQIMLDAVEAYLQIARHMPNDDPDEDGDY